MSILDHNRNYAQNLDDPSPSGKFFWFSGYDEEDHLHKGPVPRNVSLEEERDIYEAPVTENLPNGFTEENIYADPQSHNNVYEAPVSNGKPVYENYGAPKANLDRHIYENPKKLNKNGTYFKLNGELNTDSEEEIVNAVHVDNVYEQPFPEYAEIPQNHFSYSQTELPVEPMNNDLHTMDDSYGGGTWFGFSGRTRRAQSMENLLVEKENNSRQIDEQFKMIDQLVLESFDDLDLEFTEMETPNDSLEKYKHFETEVLKEEEKHDRKQMSNKKQKREKVSDNWSIKHREDNFVPKPNSFSDNQPSPKEKTSNVSIYKDETTADQFPHYTVVIKDEEPSTTEKDKKIVNESVNEVIVEPKVEEAVHAQLENFFDKELSIDFEKKKDDSLPKYDSHKKLKGKETSTSERKTKEFSPEKPSDHSVPPNEPPKKRQSSVTVNIRAMKRAQELPETTSKSKVKMAPLRKSHSFHSVPRKKQQQQEELSFASKIKLFNQQSQDLDNKPLKKKLDTKNHGNSDESPKTVKKPVDAKHSVSSINQNSSKSMKKPLESKKSTNSTDSTKQVRKPLKEKSYSLDVEPVKRSTQRIHVKSETKNESTTVLLKSTNKENTNETIVDKNKEKTNPTSKGSKPQTEQRYIYSNYKDGADQYGENFIDSFMASGDGKQTARPDDPNNVVEETISSDAITLQESTPERIEFDKKPHSLKRQTHTRNISSDSLDYSSEDDLLNSNLQRNRSFRRSIVIEDEFGHKRKKSAGSGACVSVFFTPISPQTKSDVVDCKPTFCQQFKEVLTHLDNMVVSEINFSKGFEAVKRLHLLFWDVKEAESKSSDNSESLSSVLNYLVVQEWPKVILGCLRKLQKSYPHVFKECREVENVTYYSGHMPSLLRMNRTSSEFAISVIFDGLLKAAIYFTDVHEASRIASCEDKLIGYLLEEIIPQLHNVHWGKVTAREMFLKSICDLVYNCAKTPSNASYLLEHECVNIFTELREETFDIVDARSVNMTMLLSLSFLIDDNNYDLIIPREDSIIRLLQFLDKSLEHSEHTFNDFTALELTNCLSRIAGHDTNKVLITRNSGQEILHKLLKYAYNDEERLSACNALWNLAFSREAKDILRGMGKLMNELRSLKGSQNAMLRHAASGVLWECEEKYDIKGTREGFPARANHVMISYEYEAQPLVIGIRDELHRQGYSVWMNTDGDERTLQEIMTKGVESASVVIAAITRQYKQSPHTFAELDYAHKLRRLIIPVVIDVDFVPDGWLKELTQLEKTFDFSRRSMFNGSLDALIEHVKTVTGPKGNDASSSELINNTTSGKNRNTDVLSWTSEDVIDWLKENQLIRSLHAGGRLEKFTGLHLLMFFDLKKESPDYYYSVLDSHLGFKDVLDTLEFTYALDRLLGSERLI